MEGDSQAHAGGDGDAEQAKGPGRPMRVVAEEDLMPLLQRAMAPIRAALVRVEKQAGHAPTTHARTRPHCMPAQPVPKAIN